MRPPDVALALISGALLVNVASVARSDRATVPDLYSKHPEDVVDELLEEGSVVLPQGDDDFEGFRALLIFKQPPARVMQLLSQSARQAEYRPELREVQTIGRNVAGTTEQHRLRIAFVDVVYRVHTRTDFAQSRIAWALDPHYDNAVERIEGSWKVDELSDGRSLGHFSTIVDVGAALPDFLENAIAAKLLPSTIENIRRWVDSDGRYRP